MNILIKQIFESDAGEIIRFIKSNAKDAFPKNQLPIALLESINPQAESCIANSICFKASINDQLIGIIISTGIEGGVSTIIWLLVDPGYRRLGIGLQLFKFLVESQKSLGAHKIKLTVTTKDAMEYYLKIGFVVEGHHQNHWYKMNYWSMAYFLNPELPKYL